MYYYENRTRPSLALLDFRHFRPNGRCFVSQGSTDFETVISNRTLLVDFFFLHTHCSIVNLSDMHTLQLAFLKVNLNLQMMQSALFAWNLNPVLFDVSWSPL